MSAQAPDLSLRTAALATALLAVAACSTTPSQTTARAGDAAEGKRVAQDMCASCHNVGPSGTSPAAGAPPFRHVLAGYHPATLEADLKRAAAISHRNMPTFVLTDEHAEDLVAYLVSIQVREADY